MKTLRSIFHGVSIALVLVSLGFNSVSAGTTPAPLQPPFSLKITFDSDQLRDIQKKNIPLKKSYLLGFSDGMIIEIDPTGKVNGFAWIHSEVSDSTRKNEGRLFLTGSYKKGKISASWTYSGVDDIEQRAEFYFVADRTFEGSGDFYSTSTIGKDGGRGYLSGEMTWTHEECDKQDTDTRSPTFGACLQKSIHVDTEQFEIDWTAVPVGDHCFNLRLKNDWGDSRARFNALTGTIETNCDPEERDWDAAYMKQILYVGDHIASRQNSSVILQFADMNTYIMESNTEIVIETPPEQETKLQLVMGRLWNNTKKLLYEGTMDIETTQAVAGIKGTTLVMETDGSTTTLKVIAGTVEFTSKATGDKVLVSAGEQVSASFGGLSEITSFDIAAETGTWLPYVDDPTILEPSEGAEFLPADYYKDSIEDVPVIESESGILRKLWKNTFGKLCAGIFPGLAAIILTINYQKKTLLK